MSQGDKLVGLAAVSTPEELARHCQRLAALAAGDGGIGLFERQRRATRLRRWVGPDGMFHVHGVFDPETGTVLWGAIDRQIETLFHDRHPDTTPTDPGDRQDHLAALALVDLVSTRTDTGTSMAASGDGRPGGPGGDAGSEPDSGGSGGSPRYGPRVEMRVHLDFDTLLHGLHTRSVIDSRLRRHVAGRNDPPSRL